MKRKLFSLLLILCMMLTLFPTGALAADPGTYNTSDIAAINAIIDAHPGKTGMTKADPADGSEVPADWAGVHWSEDASNKRVIKLYLNGKYISGTLDVSGLTALQVLSLYANEFNEIKLSAAAPYTAIDVRHNFLQNTSSVTGKEGIFWDDMSFFFDPQYRHITYDANGGTGTMTPGKALQAAPFTFPENGFSPPTGSVFRAWAVGSPGGTQKAPGAVDTFMEDTTVYAVWEKVTTYNPGDIAAVNAIIANNHPTGITKADPADGSEVPADWTGVHWSDDATNKRIIRLSLNARGMTGTLDVSSLTALQVLNCYNNGLTEIKLCGEANYTAFDVRLNYMTDTSAVTGKDGIVWDDEFNFNSFSPQYRWITFDANGGTGDMAPEKRAEETYYHLPENGFTAPPKRPFLGWAIGSPSGPFMVTGGAYPVSTDITIYAVWEDIHVTGVKLNKNTLAIGLGDSETLVATVSPEDATNKSVTWESEDPTVAAVDENGKVTALALGTTKIKATSNDINDYWDECEVSVVKKQTMKFNPDGGKWKDSSTDPLIISAIAGAEITIPEAPTREGYKFQYWKGSKHNPGDKYRVPEGGHEFTAVWAKASSPVENYKTGDNMGVYMWSSLAIFAVVSVILVQHKKKQSRKD